LTGVVLFAAMVMLSQLALSNWHESETRAET
jgi:NitT/TauT family transport system permease protein